MDNTDFQTWVRNTSFGLTYQQLPSEDATTESD